MGKSERCLVVNENIYVHLNICQTLNQTSFFHYGMKEWKTHVGALYLRAKYTISVTLTTSTQ